MKPEPSSRQRRIVTRGEVIIVLVIVALLALVTIPAFLKTSKQQRENTYNAMCCNNLHMIFCAKEMADAASPMADNATPSWSDLRPFFSNYVHTTEYHLNKDYYYLTNGIPCCPCGGSYTIGPMTNRPTCTKGRYPRFHFLNMDIRN